MHKKNLSLILGIILIGAIIFTFIFTLTPEYKTISPKEVKEQLDSGKKVVLLDVRTVHEYQEKHIPNSVLVPLHTIEEKITEVIPDKNIKIFVYCRSGNRSKTATKLLLKLGYTNVYDLGGINSWPYETKSL